MRNGHLEQTGGHEPVIVWRGSSDAEAAELALVLAAAGIQHESIADARHERLLVVPAAVAPRAAAELAAYRDERAHVPQAPTPLPEFAGAWSGVAGYAAALLLVALAERGYAFGFDWLAAGELDTGRVLHGELWRIATALTLHADAEHLLSNLGFGAFFGYFVARYFGYGAGWLSILVGGALGNLLNCFLQPADHRAIGASTAVFAALGLLTANAWLRGRRQASWRSRVAPIAAGIGLLAFTGTAGQNTDIFAHLFGFAAGFAIGALLARTRMPRSGFAQASLGAAAAVVLALAWAFGLALAG